MNATIPPEYEEAARERKVIPFVGAGFSKNIAGHMPSWSQVMTQVADALGFDPEILPLHGDFLQIAEYLMLRGKEGSVFSELQNSFHSPAMSVDASLPHRLLTYVDTPSIFTTNWDFWIERSFEREGMPYVKLASPRDFYEREVRDTSPPPPDALYNPAQRSLMTRTHPTTSVIKFHGDFTDHSSMVFAERKYFDRMAFEDPLDIHLRSEILGRSVLFVGYSFSDRNIRFIWHRLARMMVNVPAHARRPSFLISSGASHVQQALLQQYGIQVIQVQPDAVGEGIAEVLERTIAWQES